MAKGFNLPDQAPARAGRIAREETLRQLYGLGMTHVRLPAVAEYVLAPFSGPATISSALDDLDRAIERLLGIGYSVSIDLHPGSDFNASHQRDPQSTHRALLEGWPVLAKRIGKWPQERIFAELLNEPATTDDLWRPFVEQLATAVRAILSKTYILVGPAPDHRIEALASWRPFADDRIVYVCHFYDPMMFTHQGATWDKSAPWGRGWGVPFPSAAGDPTLLALSRAAEKEGDSGLAGELRNMAVHAWDAGAISAQFAQLGRWSAQHSAPVIVNEFGVVKWKAKRADRLAWLAATRAAVEAQGFGWAHWDYDTSFGLLDDSGAIDQGVILALLGGKTRSVAPSVSATSPMTTGSDSGTK
jgi:endoglucanase